MQPEFDRAALQELFVGLSARIPHLVWTAGDDGRWTWASPRWTAYTGLSDEASLGYGWQTAIHPSDRAAMVSGWRDADARGEIDVDHRLLGADRDADPRWFNTVSRPVADGSGRIWLGTCTDIDEDRRQQQRQQSPIRHLEHRVVNVMALTRLVSRRMARASDSLESYTLHLDSRLDAISRTQALVLRDPQAGVDLASAVSEQLLAHAIHEGEHASVGGPMIRMCGVAADLICLALHELAMNAVEHGAFARPAGRLAVGWTVQPTATGRSLRLEWLESGVAMTDPSRRRVGFGSELIERVLARQLGAEAALSFQADGVRCVIALPLSRDVFAPEAPELDVRRFG